MPAIPTSSAELTPAWFEEVLSVAGYPGVRVAAALNDVISAGVGFVGSCPQFPQLGVLPPNSS